MSTRSKWYIGLSVLLLLLGAVGIGVWYGNPSDEPLSATMGKNPHIGNPKKEVIPTIGIARPVGWAAGEAPVAAAGLHVNRFADGLNHPRTLLALPNGDVLVALTSAPVQRSSRLTSWVGHLLQSWAGAGEPSPNIILLLRDANHDGVAEQRFTLLADDLDSPSGLAYANGRLYVANHDQVLSFEYRLGDTSLTSKPLKIRDLPGGGEHWMRSLLLSADGRHLYVAVGSASNIGEQGMETEQGRAAIWEIDLATLHGRQYAGGMRNPNGMDLNPATGEMWVVVQERDMFGSDVVPDYLTNVPIGAQYGWPWIYWKRYTDDRVKADIPDYLMEYVRKPEYALGAHVAALGMQFAPTGNRLGTDFANGAFIARHGSWNRKPLVGYDVVFVKFDANGNPQGLPIPVLTGFLDRGGHARGRPVWIGFAGDGGLLVSDDVGGVIWRVVSPDAPPSIGVRPVKTAHLPPRQQINNADEAQAQFDAQEGGR